MKWGINQSTFNKHYIRRGTPYTGALADPGEMPWEQFRAWIKRKIM
jgi:hypothetical protein